MFSFCCANQFDFALSIFNSSRNAKREIVVNHLKTKFFLPLSSLYFIQSLIKCSHVLEWHSNCFIFFH